MVIAERGQLTGGGRRWFVVVVVVVVGWVAGVETAVHVGGRVFRQA